MTLFPLALFNQPTFPLTPIQEVGKASGFNEQVSFFLDKFNRSIRFERSLPTKNFQLPKNKERAAKKIIEDASKTLTKVQFQNFLDIASDNLRAEIKAFKWIEDPLEKGKLQPSELEVFIESLKNNFSSQEKPTINQLLESIKTDAFEETKALIEKNPALLKELKKYLK